MFIFILCVNWLRYDDFRIFRLNYIHCTSLKYENGDAFYAEYKKTLKQIQHILFKYLFSFKESNCWF